MNERRPAAAANTSGMTKVRLVGSRPSDVETLWATPIDGALYRLENSPFFAYGVSWQDVVEAKRASESDLLQFVRRVRKSGNRTLRVVFENSGLNEPSAQDVLQRLTEMGCSYEGMQPRLVSVNIPPEADLSAVTRFLASVSDLQWEYADPTYDEVQRNVS